MTRPTLLALALALSCPLAANAQVASPLPTAGPVFTPTPPAPSGAAGPKVTLSGYDRIRWVSQVNYDLNAGTPQDAWYSFSDLRSTFTLETVWDQWKLVSSADIAGTDFDEGALMGFDQGPRQRPISVMIRHLYLDYKDPALGFSAQLGRQPSRLGFGLVSAINRDSFKLTQRLPEGVGLPGGSLTGVWVRGAKGNTQAADHLPEPPAYVTVAPGVSGTTAVNDPDGSPHELNTYALVYNAAPFAGHKLQAFCAQQVDSSQAGVYPQKRYADLNVEGAVGALRYGGEAVYLGGQGVRAAGKRADLDSFALLLTSTYTLGNVELGLTAGRGGGDVNPDDGVNNGFQSLFIDESSFAFNHLFGDDLHGFNGTDASTANGVGLNNITFLQPSVAVRLSPELSASASYTKHLATAPVYRGSGVLGKTPTASTTLASNVGDEVDLRVAYRLGVATLYGAASAFAPGDVFAHPGLSDAAAKLEVGTEVRF